MSLYPDPLVHYPQSYSGPSSTSSSPDMSVRPSSPVDTRSKNARAQARHRAKRKAYVENLENTVHQLRAALSAAGTSPDIVGQIQYLEQENARLRAESQALRAQLGGAANLSASPTSATTSMSYGAIPSPSSAYPGNDSLRLPSVADAMNLRPAASSQYIQHPGYLTDGSSSSSRDRYYESNSDYRRRVSQPYTVPRRDSALGSVTGYDKGYDAERDGSAGAVSRSSQRPYAQSPVGTPSDTPAPQGYSYSQQLYSDSAAPSTNSSFPPASTTAGAYVFNGAEDVKPFAP